MKLSQNDLERLHDRVRRGELTVTESHVEQVLIRRVMLVTATVPREVRAALNSAVKTGVLGHLRKDGNKPECYFHPRFDWMARSERNKHEEQCRQSMLNVFAIKSSDCNEFGFQKTK